ncbi:hypothetical protein HYW46_00395 [Candidatus Daviesbacteria bacterium]|nr:hypothetical protein [Candidatus Daviesbacteria bacterium]
MNAEGETYISSEYCERVTSKFIEVIKDPDLSAFLEPWLELILDRMVAHEVFTRKQADALEHNVWLQGQELDLTDEQQEVFDQGLLDTDRVQDAIYSHMRVQDLIREYPFTVSGRVHSHQGTIG